MAVLAGAGFVLAEGQGPVEDASARRPVSAEALQAFPAGSLEDWVTYGEHLAVVEVADESEIRSAFTEEHGEGYVGRRISVHVRATHWSRDGAEELPEALSLLSGAWALKDGELRRLDIDGDVWMEGGRTYMALLSRKAGGWVAVSGTQVPVEDGRIAAGLAASGAAWAEGLRAATRSAVATPADVGDVLARTPADPRAEPFGGLEPADRYAAVQRAQQGGPSSPAEDAPPGGN